MLVNKKFIYTVLILNCLSLILSIPTGVPASKEKRAESNLPSLVVEVNEANFEKFNSTNTYYYLEFYAPWCVHCQQLAPVYDKAARLVVKDNLPVKFAKVDATKNEKLVEKFKVDGYPTVLFIDNNEVTVSGYQGDKKATDFTKFVVKKLNLFKIQEIQSFDEVQKYNTTNSTSNVLLIVVNDKNLTNYERQIKILMNAGEDNTYDKVLTTNAQSIIDQFNLQNEKFAELSFIRNDQTNLLNEAERVELNLAQDLANVKSANKLLSHYKFKVYGQINNQEMNEIIEKGEPSLILFYGQETNVKTQEEVHKFMRELAVQNRKSLHIYSSSLDSKVANVIVEVMRFKKENMPMLFLTQLRKGSNTTEGEELEKYKLDNISLRKETVEKFIDDWRNEKLPLFLASEDVPVKPYDDNGILKVVGKTFDDFISIQGKDLVLAICTPIAKRCKVFYERLVRVANKLRNNTNLVIAQTDPNFNEFHINIEPKFPVIFFFPTDNNNLKPSDRFQFRMVYDEDMTTKDITEFIARNAQHNVVVETLPNEKKIHREELKTPIEVKFEGNEDDFNFDEFLQGNMGESMQNNAVGGDSDFSQLLNAAKTMEGMPGFDKMKADIGKMGGDDSFEMPEDMGNLDDMEYLDNQLDDLDNNEDEDAEPNPIEDEDVYQNSESYSQSKQDSDPKIDL